MSRILIKKIEVNRNVIIEFNKKQNYIIGANGTGKTILFNLIQYILGLKVNISRLAYTHFIENPKLECEFGDKNIEISRKLNSNIVMFKGDIQIQAKSMSSELNEIYSDLLNIQFINKFNKGAAIDILSYSFFSGLDFKKSSWQRESTYHRIIGYNSEYLDQIENDIKIFKEEIKYESQGLKFVEQYKTEIEKSISSRFSNNQNLNEISNILDYEYLKIKEQSIKNYDLLQNAKLVYKQEQDFRDTYIREKLESISPFFYRLLEQSRFLNNLVFNLSFEKILQPKNLVHTSFGERNNIILDLLLTFCRSLENLEYYNGVGLLVTDEFLPIRDYQSIDYQSINEITNKISNVVNEENLQIINFCSTNEFVPKEYVVYEMPKRQGGGIFER